MHATEFVERRSAVRVRARARCAKVSDNNDERRADRTASKGNSSRVSRKSLHVIRYPVCVFVPAVPDLSLVSSSQHIPRHVLAE